MVDVPPQNQDGSHWLNCLIEGEYNVLPVAVGVHEKVIYLQGVIRSSAAQSLKDVDPYNLELWKASAFYAPRSDIDLLSHSNRSTLISKLTISAT